MKENWRLFRLLMWKNYLIRKRHWKVALFLQILFPICILLFWQKLRSVSGIQKAKDYVTYYPIETKESLEEDIDEVLLYYSPENNFTRTLMNLTRQCLSLDPASMYNLNNKWPDLFK